MEIRFIVFIFLFGIMQQVQGSITMENNNQQQIPVYLFPGQGSDSALFSGLHFDSRLSLHYIQLPTPEKNADMRDYALQIMKQIDTANHPVLIGVSLGGMVCTELADIVRCRKVIIISSAIKRSELPFRYRFQRYIPLYKLVPCKMMKKGALMLQPVVEPDRNKDKEVFKKMLGSKDPLYIKRTVNLIIRWDRNSYNPNIIHIHGDDDHTIPIKHVKADYIIKDGSHMMTLTKADEISELLNKLLCDL